MANIDLDAITHPYLRIGWDPVSLDSELYAGLVQQRGHPTDCRVSDELLMAALQQYKQSSQQYETYCTEEKSDALFLDASQLLNVETLDNSVVVKPSGKQQVDVEPLDNPLVVKPSSKRRFGQPQCEKDIQAVTSHACRRRRFKTLNGLKAFSTNGLLTSLLLRPHPARIS